MHCCAVLLLTPVSHSSSNDRPRPRAAAMTLKMPSCISCCHVSWDVFRGCQCCTIRTAKLACIISSCRRPPEGVDGRCHGADTTKLVVLCYTDEGTQGPRLDSDRDPDFGLIRSGLPSCAWRLKYTRKRVNHHYNTHVYTCTRLKSITLRPKPSLEEEESRVLGLKFRHSDDASFLFHVLV